MKTENKKIIIVDMDEVLYEDWAPRVYCDFAGIDFTKFQRNFKYIQELFSDKKELDKFVDFFLSKPNYYDNVPLMPGARNVMERLNEKYLLYICTDYLFKNYEWDSDKVLVKKTEALKRDFPFVNPAQYIFMRGKQLLNADYLIDDRPWNFGPHIGTRLLFTGPFNKDMTDDELESKNITRVNSWKEIGELLL